MKKTTTPSTRKIAKPKAATESADKKPAVKRAKQTTNSTRILANVDIGFGNTLYIRGEGPGLSWESGIAMSCDKDDLWSINLESATRPVVFKFLINDESWCIGDDYAVDVGAKITLVPEFS